MLKLINFIKKKISLLYILYISIIDREKVTEQIITHWFQNKRKFSRKSIVFLV